MKAASSHEATRPFLNSTIQKLVRPFDFCSSRPQTDRLQHVAHKALQGYEF